MNGLKTLLAASSLALAAGSAHATVYSFNTTWTNAITGCTACSGSGSGSGTWDSTTSLLDFTGTENLHIDFQDGSAATNATVSREFFINTLTLSFTHITTACTDNTGSVCGSDAQALNQTRPTGDKLFEINPNVVISSGFVWDAPHSLRVQQTGVQNRTFTFTNLTPVSSVPVPAAAWLFGSGLLGLAGATRKRQR